MYVEETISKYEKYIKKSKRIIEINDKNFYLRYFSFKLI